MRHTEPLQGAGSLVYSAGRTLYTEQLSPQLTNFLANTNTILNALIGLQITLVVVFFIAHLTRWALCGVESERGKASAQGAVRAFFALFLMVDVWFFIRLLERIENFSPAVGYAMLLISFLILTCWSLLGIGDMIIDAISALANSLAARAIALVRGSRSSSRLILRLQSMSDTLLRFFTLIFFISLVLVFGLYWSFVPGGRDTGSALSRAAQVDANVVASAVAHDPDDSQILYNTYVNRRYGIEITFPAGWELEESTSTNGLLKGYNRELGTWATLNAGTYDDLTGGTEKDHLAAFWRVQRSVLSGAAQESVGVRSVQEYQEEPIGGTYAGSIHLAYYWQQPDGSAPVLNENTYVFGKGPTYFTLQFSVYGDDADFGAINRDVVSILDSVSVGGGLQDR